MLTFDRTTTRETTTVSNGRKRSTEWGASTVDVRTAPGWLNHNRWQATSKRAQLKAVHAQHTALLIDDGLLTKVVQASGLKRFTANLPPTAFWPKRQTRLLAIGAAGINSLAASSSSCGFLPPCLT